MEKFANGKAEGLREDQVRAMLVRDRVLSEEEVLRRLIDEAEGERDKGQRGLTRFLNRWKKALAEKEKPSPDSDWSLLAASQAVKGRDQTAWRPLQLHRLSAQRSMTPTFQLRRRQFQSCRCPESMVDLKHPQAQPNHQH